MKKIKKYLTTKPIRAKLEILFDLKELLNKIMKPRPFWSKQFNLDDLIRIQKEASIAKNELVELIWGIYPELKGKNFEINPQQITIN